MKQDLRKCIQQEKKLVKDKEIFGTKKYLKLLKTITNEITDGTFNHVKIYENPTDGLGGWWDGRTIAINIANSLTQSFPDIDSRSDSIVGILGHECGHKNYSFVALRRMYLQGIDAGTWYPKPPHAENTQEKKFLLQMRECFHEKNPIALGIIRKTAAYINNLLEDVFIEKKMCAKYPGSIRRGISQNRERRLEQMPSLKQQANEGYKKLSIFLNMLVQYALSGNSSNVNKWDGCDGIEWNVFLTLCPVIDKAVAAEEASARFFATNQMILKLWPIIWDQVQEIKETQQESENQKEEEKQEKQEKQNEEEQDEKGKKGTEKQQNQDGTDRGTEKAESPENKTEGKNPEKDDVKVKKEEQGESNSESETSPALEKALKTLTQQLYDFLQKEESGKEEQRSTDSACDGMTADNDHNAQLDEAEKGAQENGKGTKEFLQKNIEVGEETQDILFEIAKERAEQKIQQKMSEELRKAVKDVPFHEGHSLVKKELKRNIEVNRDDVADYGVYEEQVKCIMRRLKTLLVPVLQKQDGTGEQKLLFGKKLDYKHISDFQGRIFQNKSQPGQVLQVSIGVLVDLSLSMKCGKRMEVAKLTALCLYEFCRTLHIPVAIYGHHTDGQVHFNLAEETLYLHSLAEFTPDVNDSYRILTMNPQGANRDGAALQYMGHKLLSRQEKQKILVLISDGFPNSNFYRGDDAKRDLLKIKKDLERKGILFFAAAIGSDREAIKEIYQEAFLDISEIERLPVILSKQIIKRIKRRM